MERRRQQDAFTLIELLVVIIIVAILTGIAIPMYFSQRDKAKDAALKQGVHSLELGLGSYAVDHNDVYPPTVESLTLSLYVDRWPVNPWTGVAMGDSGGIGDYTYTPNGVPATGYVLAGHMSHGQDFTIP